MKKGILILLTFLLLTGCTTSEDKPMETMEVLVSQMDYFYSMEKYGIDSEYTKHIYRYNAYGQLIEERMYLHGVLENKTLREYDRQGNLLSDTTYEFLWRIPKPAWKGTYTYDDQNRKIFYESKDYGGDTHTYTYSYPDEYGSVSWKSSSGREWVNQMDRNGNLILEQIIDNGMQEETRYTYNENGFLIRADSYENKQLSSYFLYTVDDQGRNLRFESYSGDGVLQTYQTYEYDPDGLWKKTVYESGEYQIEYYDANENQIRTEEYNADGTLVSSSVYTYRTIDIRRK